MDGYRLPLFLNNSNTCTMAAPCVHRARTVPSTPSISPLLLGNYPRLWPQIYHLLGKLEANQQISTPAKPAKSTQNHPCRTHNTKPKLPYVPLTTQKHKHQTHAHHHLALQLCWLHQQWSIREGECVPMAQKRAKGPVCKYKKGQQQTAHEMMQLTCDVMPNVPNQPPMPQRGSQMAT